MMIIWINGTFGAGKTQSAFELNRRLDNSHIYDPEHVGFFMRKKMPKNIWNKDNFQDYPLWRELNFSLIKHIDDNYDGVLIIPMTIVNPQYFNEIITALRDDGHDVKHYALMASKEALLKRLKSRGDGPDSWAAKHLDECLNGLSSEVFKHHINTENMSIDDVVEEIASLSGLELKADNTTKFSKKIRRMKIQLKQKLFFLDI